ncbi:MAG: polysaccharide deacetylase family protein, partial [Rhizobiaceae bacterium]
RLEDLPALLSDGDPSSRYFAVTLDDGYRNNAEHAAPVFRQHKVPYTIFICPGLVNRTRTMWWETAAAVLRQTNSISFDFGNGIETHDTASAQAKHKAFNRFAELVTRIDEDEAVEQINALAKSIGFNPMSIVDKEIMNEAELAALANDPLCTLGGHTLTHRNLARLSPDRMREEITASCDLVSTYAKRPVKTFAYPYGWAGAAGPREFKACSELGLSVAVTTRPGMLQPADTANMIALKRVSLNGHYQEKRYVSALISGLPFKFLSK